MDLQLPFYHSINSYSKTAAISSNLGISSVLMEQLLTLNATTVLFHYSPLKHSHSHWHQRSGEAERVRMVKRLYTRVYFQCCYTVQASQPSSPSLREDLQNLISPANIAHFLEHLFYRQSKWRKKPPGGSFMDRQIYPFQCTSADQVLFPLEDHLYPSQAL